MLRPLGLPPGSVRALLLLGLAARAILDLKDGRELASWLVAALVVSAASYFSARAVGLPIEGHPSEGAAKPRPPLGLPAGTIRTLFLIALGYGVWLWQQRAGGGAPNPPVVWVLGAFVLGVVLRAFLMRFRRAEDPSTGLLWHVQALVVVIAMGGLVALGVTRPADLPAWIEPLMAAAVTYYFGWR